MGEKSEIEHEKSSNLKTPKNESLEEEVDQRLGEKYDRIRPSNQSKQEYVDETAWELFDSADRIAAAHKRGEKLAYIDQLTGLPNRRGFEESLALAYKEAAQNPGTEVYLFMLDLDDFSLVNNTFGHAVGDQVLKITADTIKKGIRPTDSPARVGGEEIAVVFINGIPTFENQHIEKMDPVSITDRLRADINRNVQQEVRVEDGKKVLKQSVSAGISQLRVDPGTGAFITPQHLKEEADIALYHAKYKGKDRTIVFEEGMKMPPPTARKIKAA